MFPTTSKQKAPNLSIHIVRHKGPYSQDGIITDDSITDQSITDKNITDDSITYNSITGKDITGESITNNPVIDERIISQPILNPPTSQTLITFSPIPTTAMLLPPRHYALYTRRYPDTFHTFLTRHPYYLPEHSYYLLECSRPTLSPLPTPLTRITNLLSTFTPTNNPALTLSQSLTNTLLSPVPQHLGVHETVAMVATYHTLSIYAACAMVTHYVEIRPTLLPPFETAQDAALKQVEILKQFRALLPEMLAGRMEAASVLQRLIPEFVKRRGVLGWLAPYFTSWSLRRDHRVLVETLYRVLYVMVREAGSAALCPDRCFDCGVGRCLRERDPEGAEARERTLWLGIWGSGLEVEQKRVVREMCGVEPGEGNWVAVLWEKIFRCIPKDVLREEGDAFWVMKDDVLVDGRMVVHVWRLKSTVERWGDDESEDEMEEGYVDSEFAIDMGMEMEDKDYEMGFEPESPRDSNESDHPRAIVMVDKRDPLSDEESDVFYYESSEAEEEEEDEEKPSGEAQIALSSGPVDGDMMEDEERDEEEGGVPINVPSTTSFETVDLGEYLRPETATPVNSEQANWRSLRYD